jgi:predicted ATPase
MRIAISGTHRSGKSTLLAELAERLPKYKTVDEPYQLMEEDGYEFCHPPSLKDFEAQLERSVESLSGSGENVLFDRCPADLLGYISVHEDVDGFDFDDWLPWVRAALETLDLIVFVPVEAPDRISCSPSDDEGGTRLMVDEKLKQILLEDSLGLGVEVLEVEGELESRVKTVLERISSGRA